jgi:hypothetical protein
VTAMAAQRAEPTAQLDDGQIATSDGEPRLPVERTVVCGGS